MATQYNRQHSNLPIMVNSQQPRSSSNMFGSSLDDLQKATRTESQRLMDAAGAEGAQNSFQPSFHTGLSKLGNLFGQYLGGGMGVSEADKERALQGQEQTANLQKAQAEGTPAGFYEASRIAGMMGNLKLQKHYYQLGEKEQSRFGYEPVFDADGVPSQVETKDGHPVVDGEQMTRTSEEWKKLGLTFKKLDKKVPVGATKLSPNMTTKYILGGDQRANLQARYLEMPTFDQGWFSNLTQAERDNINATNNGAVEAIGQDFKRKERADIYKLVKEGKMTRQEAEEFQGATDGEIMDRAFGTFVQGGGWDYLNTNGKPRARRRYPSVAEMIKGQKKVVDLEREEDAANEFFGQNPIGDPGEGQFNLKAVTYEESEKAIGDVINGMPVENWLANRKALGKTFTPEMEKYQVNMMQYIQKNPKVAQIVFDPSRTVDQRGADQARYLDELKATDAQAYSQAVHGFAYLARVPAKKYNPDDYIRGYVQ